MSHNPFTSKIYQSSWLKHFTNGETGAVFQFLKGLKFYKHRFLPYYINVGRNCTNGITYETDHSASDYKNKTVLVYDVPDYCHSEDTIDFGTLKHYKVRQYKGFLAKLGTYDSLESYMLDAFSAKSRNKHRSTIKKLETCFDVSYHIYDTSMSKADYDTVIQGFKNIVMKRYDSLQLDTNLISEWPFYEEIIYPMLQNGQAMLISVNMNGVPEAMSLAFIQDDKMTGAIKAFNPNYYKFNIGHIELGKLIEWCITNKISTLDFSKGEYEYKTKWTNQEYLYHCHILYDVSSFKSRITAYLLAKYFELKQYLRDRHFNLFVVKFKYKLKNLKGSTSNKPPFSVSPMATDMDLGSLIPVELDSEPSLYLKRILFDVLYRKPEPIQAVKLYKNPGERLQYYIVGNKNKLKIDMH